MQFINFLAIFLGFLGLAIAQDAYPTASIVSSSTEIYTRTIRISQVSTVTSTSVATSSSTEAPSSSSTEAPSSSSVYVTASQNSTVTTLSPSSTKMTLSASAPIGTGNVIPTKSASPPVPTDFKGAAPALSAFGAAGAIAMAFAAML